MSSHPYPRDEVARGHAGMGTGCEASAADPRGGHVGTVTRGHGSKDLAQRETGDRMIGWGLR